ncbi:MAG: hypothetical protein HKL87_00840 [Acidimicrobiaceae bacterium]|nr:hypothetical protein [Acidimicrobiaceae bacterium]
MNPVTVSRLLDNTLASLAVAEEALSLEPSQRSALLTRLAGIPSARRTVLDSFRVESGAKELEPFQWCAENVARSLSHDLLVRESRPRFLGSALDSLISDLVSSAESGLVHSRSAATWLAQLGPGGRAMVHARILTRARHTLEVFDRFGVAVTPSASDTYLSVARSRWVLRGRRDGVLGEPHRRILVQVRTGSPSRSAARGLRVDALAATLAHPRGQAPARIVGVWPESGLVIAVDSSLDDLRGGARDVLRAAQRLSEMTRNQAA